MKRFVVGFLLVTGKVTGEAMNPLPNANIVLLDSFRGFITDNLSDTLGKFKLETHKRAYFLKVSQAGYSVYEKRLDSAVLRRHLQSRPDAKPKFFRNPKQKSFLLELFVQDVFKTDTDDYSIKTPGFLYENKFYGDKKFVGFCVIWKKSGEKYKKREIEEIKDKNINRLHPE